MMPKIASYALVALAMVVMVFSSVRIGLSIVGEAISKKVDVSKVVDHENQQIVDENDLILPISQRKLAASRGDLSSDVLPNLLQMSSNARKIDESKLPYKCGVIMFYHIPGTGGTVINDWLKELSNENKATYFSSAGQTSQAKDTFVNAVEERIRNLGANDWAVIYANENTLSLNTDDHYLSSWRASTEKKKCHFVATTAFQDPMDHSVSHTKKEFAECNCKMMDFKEKLQEVILERPWTGQLDYLLFNNGKIEDTPMKDKVKRGMRILKQHFDLVVVDDHNKFAETILKVAGWESSFQIKGKVLSDGELVFSKDLVSQYGKMSSKNGDSDFIDAVNHVYHNSLGYLMA